VQRLVLEARRLSCISLYRDLTALVQVDRAGSVKITVIPPGIALHQVASVLVWKRCCVWRVLKRLIKSKLSLLLGKQGRLIRNSVSLRRL